MTGLCCRHQVRHDDWLCCAHGVEHRGDIGDTLLGVQRDVDHGSHDTWPLVSQPGRVWCRTCQVEFDADVRGGSGGFADIGTVVAAAVGGAILAACLWLGYHAGDWPKVLAGLALGIAGAFVLVWIAGQEHRSVDDHPAGHRPGTVRLDYTPRRGDEPKER